MNIEVKGINDVLMMKMNKDCCFCDLLQDLDTLLDQPIFLQDGYYPKAFFDFDSRILSKNEMIDFLQLLKNKKRVLFDGMMCYQKQRHFDIIHQQIHNGEEIFIHHETLILGIVNPGSYVYCYDHVYFLNTVRGTIVMMNQNIKVFGHDFKHAHIIMNQYSLQDVTTSTLTSFYYRNHQIIMQKEDCYEQDNSYYIG